jgi:hypothetical protein
MVASGFGILLCLASALPTPDTVVVCPDQFRETMAPWIKHRSEQGHQMVLLSNKLSANELRGEIRRLAKLGSLKSVLLVGDAEPGADRDPDIRARSIPTHLIKAKVNVRWGSEPHIATDNWYADVDDDGLPDLAVGRLTADSKEELAIMVRKILAYEANRDFSMWRRRVNFVAGVGGFGKLADSVLESATKKLITGSLPSTYCVSMTHASWRSAYFPNPRRFRETSLDRFNEGCLFWVYIGHGQRHYLDHVHVPGARYPIMSNDDVVHLKASKGLPIAIFLACYTGAFDDPRDCLAEEMLRVDGGPVAVFSGSRVTMPYSMAVMSHELLDQYFNKRCETLGQLTLNAKRRMVAKAEEGEKATATRRMIESVAVAISPSRDLLDEERFEHLSLFNLFGDPLLRLHYPDELKVSALDQARAGDSLQVELKSPIGGRCTIELVCRRDRLRSAAPNRPRFETTAAALTNYDRTYAQANDKRWHVEQRDIKSGTNSLTLEIPANARGSSHVRAYVEGENRAALGATDIYIRPQQVTYAE